MSVVSQPPSSGVRESGHEVHMAHGPSARVTAPVQPKSVADVPFWSRRKSVVVAAVMVLVGITSVAWRWGATGSTSTEELVFHTVRRGDLDITVVERGNLESQNNLEILCEVDDVRRDGINGTPLIWVIENGSQVKKGDLLVELDSAPIQEQIDEQILETEQAREKYMLAQAIYDNQVTQNETDAAEAKLKVELAELELQMFEDEQSGTHHLEVEEIKRRIDDVNNQLLAAQASSELKRNERDGIERLFRLGYAGKSELDRAVLDVLQSESTYAATVNKLQTEIATLKKKETFERKMQELQLRGKLETAQRNLKQVANNNQARLSQAKASLESRKELLAKEEELLKRYREQLDKCKIYAPQDGMVAYATVSSHDEPIRAGLPVRARQHILSLPDLTKMQVVTSIHESVLDQVQSGLRATIRVDAFPDKTYPGTVKQVAVLPDQTGWYNSDTKAYETKVVIDQEVQDLKPGMTAVVEIHIDHLKNVLTVPVQAVVAKGKRTFCYVKNSAGEIELREVQLGKSNEQLVQVLSGIAEGDRVVLNPGALAGGPEPAREKKSSGQDAV